MGGRSDYQERKNRKIERYKELSIKAKEKSKYYQEANASKIAQVNPGQPIIVGHHSEEKYRKIVKDANDYMRKSIKFDDKSNYYIDKVKTVENNKAIYNDDPNAIKKLKEKLERLENERENIKKREHQTYELTNIGANIRETKKRIERLEKLENFEFPDMNFTNGKAIHNKEINRIQLIFEEIPNVDIRKELKHSGFRWSKQEKAWQREFNYNGIRATKKVIKNVLNQTNINEKVEEEEFE